MAKTLEEIIREKLATGYDPVTLELKSSETNEENIVATIDGLPFSIRANTVSFVGKTPVLDEAEEDPNPTPAGLDVGVPPLPEDPNHPINEGGVENPAPAETALTGHEDLDADGVEDELQAQIAAILKDSGGVELKPVGTTDDALTIFAVISSSGDEIIRGTIDELVSLIIQNQNKEAAETA